MKVLQAERNEAKAENDSAFERLRADMARHNAEQNARMTEQSAKITEQNTKMAEQNTKIAEQSKEMVKFIVAMAATTIGILGGIIVLVQFFS